MLIYKTRFLFKYPYAEDKPWQQITEFYFTKNFYQRIQLAEFIFNKKVNNSFKINFRITASTWSLQL